MVASIAPSLQRPRLRCCDASSCRAAGSGALLKALETARSNGGEAAELLEIKPVGCLRLCSQGPLVALDRPDLHAKVFTAIHGEHKRLIDKKAMGEWAR